METFDDKSEGKRSIYCRKTMFNFGHIICIGNYMVLSLIWMHEEMAR